MDEIRIELTVPADPRVVAGIRLFASGLGSEFGLDLDAIEDLRMAVGELMSAAIEASKGANLGVTYRASEARVQVEVEGPSGVDFAECLDEIAAMILDEVADEYHLDAVRGAVTVERNA